MTSRTMIVKALDDQNVLPTHLLYEYDKDGTVRQLDKDLKPIPLGYVCVGVPRWAVEPVDFSDIELFDWY